MRLGPLTTLWLADARELAADCQKQVARGIDAIEPRKAERGERVMTFDECRDASHAADEPEWKSAKHGCQWLATLETYATSTIGKLLVDCSVHSCRASSPPRFF
jgi:hypothetical protein